MRNRKWVGCLAIVLLVLAAAAPALACTGFAVYSPEGAYYGMNFDFPKVPMYVRIADVEGFNRFFAMSYEVGDFTLNDAMMNEQGMLTTMQDHYPLEPYEDVFDEDYESVVDFAIRSPYMFGDAESIRMATTDGKPLKHMFGSLHNLFADIYGDAVIVEVIDGETVLTDIEGPYIIMTNFAVDQLREVEPMKAKGYGQDRYVTAQKMIEETIDTFDLEKAFDVLIATAQSKYAYYPTIFSVVHDPQNLTSYFALYQNYDQIWQVTLEDGMLRTYNGFTEPMEMALSDEGVSVDVLVEYEQAHVEEG